MSSEQIRKIYNNGEYLVTPQMNEKLRFGFENMIIQMPSQVGGFLKRIQERITPEQLTEKLASFEQNIKLHVV